MEIGVDTTVTGGGAEVEHAAVRSISVDFVREPAMSTGSASSVSVRFVAGL